MADAWPLVGRRAELDRVVAGLVRGRAPAMVLDGPAGVGKTRLAAEATRVAARRGVTVHRVRATHASATIPFGPCAALLPARGDAPTEAGLLRAVAAELVAVAPGRVAVWVDDAHLLDPSSAALVHHLVVASPVVVLLTRRTGAPAPDAVTVLTKDEPVERIVLAGLDRQEVATLLEAVLGGQVDGALAGYLARLSGGNPMLLRELVDAALAAGSLTAVAGVWRGSGPIVGRTLPDAVRARIDAMAPAVREAAELVAFAEPLAVELAERLLGPDVARDAERDGLLAVDDGGGVRLAHPLYAEALRAALSPLRRRALSRTLAAATVDRPQDALRRAVWILDGGGSAPPADLLAAARRAHRAFDHPLALRLARAAVDAGGGFDAELLVARLLPWVGRPGESDALFARLVDAAPDAGRRVRTAVQRSAYLNLAHGDPLAAEAVLAGVTDPAHADELALARGVLQFSAGDIAAAVRSTDGVVDRLDPDGLLAARAQVFRGAVLVHGGRLAEGLALTDRAMATAERAGHTALAFLAGSNRSAALCSLQGPEAALASCRYAEAVGRGSRTGQATWAMNLGIDELNAGRAGTAARWLREAIAWIPTALLDTVVAHHCLDALAEAAALTGRLDEARAALHRLRTAVAPRQRFPVRSGGELWLLAAEGRLADARAAGLAAAEVLERAGNRLLAAHLLHDVARLGFAADVAEPLARSAAEVGGVLLPPAADFAAALAAGDADGCSAAADRLEAAGFHLCAADGFAHASRLSAGTGRGRTAAARARRAAARCEGALTPALRHLDAGPSPLTVREREVAGLAAAGLSDREIAARLTLSERTVHSHLHRAYAKLGVPGRAALPVDVR